MHNNLSTKLICLGVALTVAIPFLTTGCEEQPHGEDERPEAHKDREAEHRDDHHDEVHLGESMNELSMRFSAVWFAGKAGNAEMVDYQIHEIEEMVDELRPAAPQENGVDVVERLDADILSGLEDVEEAVESSEPEAFEASYRSVMESCGSCHHSTGHGFIKPKIPDYNPYPNLDLSGRD
ncbi:MAG: hypothetical protein ACLFVJ_05715 [Persicimonas sp.]